MLAIAGCSVHESTRTGGLVPPSGTAAPAASPAATLATIVASSSAAAGAQPPGTSSATTQSPGTAPATTQSPDTAPATTQPPPTTAIDPLAQARQVLATATPPDGFAEGVLGGTGPAGMQLWPVIVADTPNARQRGLMGVEDFSTLGGYAAMVFIFDRDTSGAFWMRDTPVPLRITFVTASGSVVSVADMVPCLPPTPSDECERYHPAGRYRIAIEHPADPAFDIGLAAAELVEVTVEQRRDT